MVPAVAGVEKVAGVVRLPESVALEQVAARVARCRAERAVRARETDLGPAFVDFAENPHVVAVGRAQSGRTNFLRVMMPAIMARYSPDEATIVLIDPRRRLVGVVPEEWLAVATRTPAATSRRCPAGLAQLFERVCLRRAPRSTTC